MQEKTPRIGINLLMTFLVLSTSYWLYWCVRVFASGHGSFATSAYGAYWGLIVANVIHLIGISHVGIAISAAVRVLGLKRFRAAARIAELVTLVALVTAVINIAVDVGRPDRFIVNTLFYGNWRAPMVWSMTVITLYLTASGVYLFLSLRSDMWHLSQQQPGRWRLPNILANGYQGTTQERERHERTLYWLALVLLPVMVSVHSVYGLFFGLLASKPGWYNPLQAPYFVLGAIVSGFSAIIVVAGLLRTGLRWQDTLTDRVFRAFSALLTFVVFLYLYFLASEHLTAQYFPATAEKAVSDALLSGRFATLFWVTVIGGLVIPFTFLFVQSVRRGRMRLGMTVVAALLINVAMFFKRVILVLSAQYHPHLPLPHAATPYSPSHAEVVITLGSYGFGALLFLFFLKTIPVVELPAMARVGEAPLPRHRFASRRMVLLLSLFAGVALIAWGIVTREADFAPLKWVVGLLFLVALPLESCMINDSRGGEGTKPKGQLT